MKPLTEWTAEEVTRLHAGVGLIAADEIAAHIVALRERAEKDRQQVELLLAHADRQSGVVTALRETLEAVLPHTSIHHQASAMYHATRKVLADTAKAAAEHDARTRQEARRELQFLAEAVMDEHDEETTGSTALDNLLNALMDESGHELARLRALAASEPEGE